MFVGWLDQKFFVATWTSTEPTNPEDICVGHGRFANIETTNASRRPLCYLEHLRLSYNNRISINTVDKKNLKN